MNRLITSLLLSSALLATSASSFAADTAPSTTTTVKPAPAKKAKIGLVKLSDVLAERPANFKISLSDLTGEHKHPTLSSLITNLNKAAKDPALSGILFDLSSFSLTLNQAQEIGGLMTNLRKAGKRVTVYASDYDTATYVLASYADTVIMPENGNVLIPGVALQMIFFKGTLDKLHLQPDFIQIGKFKGAEEPFMRTTPSPEYQEQIQRLVDGMYKEVISTISTNRPNMEEKDVIGAIDAAWINGKKAKELGLVDQTLGRDKLDAYIDSQFPAGATIDEYPVNKKKSLDLDSPFAIFSLLADNPKPRSSAPAVAVIYAVGEILPDFVGGEDSSDMVTPAGIRKAVEAALKDDSVKAIVVRVDSPGGSASASDEIWAVLKEADKKKPVTISMGRVAASGGYYISCAGRNISADPATITGSIGVVAGKIVIKGLADEIGINIVPIAKGKHAGMLSMLQAFTPEERAFLQKSMEDTYAVFTSRVSSARGERIAHLDEVAQGRLFTGEQAKDVGLVDNVATLNEATLAAAKSVGIDKNFQTIILPEPKTFADILREGFSEDESLPLTIPALKMDPLNTILSSLPPELRNQTRSALHTINLLQSEHLLMELPGGISESH